MKEHDLTEIDLQQGEVRIQLRRGSSAAATVIGVPQAAPAAGAGGRRSACPGIGCAGRGRRFKGIVLIKSPMVGTFYAAPDPIRRRL